MDYRIDFYGNIYKGIKSHSSYDNGTGYKQSKLRKDKKRYNRYVHRLVWESFIGIIPKGYELNHIDHDKSNNQLSNLELVTHSENLKKAFIKHGYWGTMFHKKIISAG